MIRKAINVITGRISGLQKAAFWLAFFSFLSLLLGFLRDRILAHYFGAGLELDTYYAAFEIPDLLFATVASLVGASILVPMFSEREDKAALLKFINSIFSAFSLLLVSACLLAFVFMPQLVKIFFPGFSVATALEVTHFSRLLLLSPFFLGLSNFFGSIVQFERRFLLFSLSPLFYNAGIIGGLLFGGAKFGVISAIFGVCFGAFLHMLTQAVFVFTSPEAPKFSKNIFSTEVKKTFLLSIPRTISLSASSLVGLFFVSFASNLSTGSIAVFTLAFNLQSVLLSLIGGSFSLAAFPTLAEHYARKDFEALTKCLSEGLRHIIFWALPATVLFVILRAHLVRVILGSGNFDWSDTRMTAAVLALFVISVVFQSTQLFLTRAHYAFSKTKIPLLVNIIGATFTVLLALSIFHFSSISEAILPIVANLLKVADLERITVLILPLSFSFGSILSAYLLYRFLDSSVRKGIRTVLRKTIIQSILSSFMLSLTVILALRIWSNVFVLDTALNVFLHGFISGGSGILIWVASLKVLKSEELKEILN